MTQRWSFLGLDFLFVQHWIYGDAHPEQDGRDANGILNTGTFPRKIVPHDECMVRKVIGFPMSIGMRCSVEGLHPIHLIFPLVESFLFIQVRSIETSLSTA